MSIKIGEMESSNEGLTAVFRSLQLVEKPIFIVESVHFGLVQWIEGDNFIPKDGNTFFECA